MVILIAAIAENNCIGRGGKLPWHIPEDLKRFKELTTGKTVLMGRKTFESIIGYLGKPLPNRKNIVITRQPNYKYGGHSNLAFAGEESPVEIYPNIESALEARKNEDVFVIGGAEIYRQTLPLADKLFITEVQEQAEGDAYFPEIDKGAWKEVSRENHKTFSFIEYAQKKKG
ncbi:MAG: dihydrofolate reductase [Nanoarchaeota archaeon]|nr:dihydrofolate reductase [Nanoarchaeota archaeon]